jgi:hypothetical protein
MTTTYYTIVAHIPPTPLGLLPERWSIQHRCTRCHERVTPEQLVPHAQSHGQAEHSLCDDLFQSEEHSGTMAPNQPELNEGTAMTSKVPNASTTTDQRRR